MFKEKSEFVLSCFFATMYCIVLLYQVLYKADLATV